jgi:hypothetical protein
MSELPAGSLPPPLPGAPIRRPWILAGLSLALYFVSLFPTALHLDKPPDWSGGAVLLMGWLGLLLPQPGWLANPLWIVSMGLLIFRVWTAAIIVSVIAVLIGLSSFAFVSHEMLLDEGAVKKAVVTGLGPAFYLWIAALAVPALAAFLGRKRILS